MAFPRLGGQGVPLSLVGALASQLPTQPGTGFSAAGPTNAITLPAASTLLLPAGTYQVMPGPVTSLQFLDPVANQWRTINAENGLQPIFIDSDGGNFRLANLTGTPVGAIITNAGSGYTNGIGATATGLTITPSAGGSVWVPVVGGAINSTIAITAAGSGYLFPPLIVIQAPPAGGIQATAVCALSGGAINSVTVINQGAGYTTAPRVTLINDFRDTVGTGGVLTVNATLVGSGSLLAMYPSNPGTALTAVPTFTFNPASTTAATAIMNFVLTGFSVGAGGAAYGNAQPFLLLTNGGIVAGSRASNTAGPLADTGLTQPRLGMIAGTSTAGGAITATGAVVVDPGFGFQAVPTLGVVPAGNSLPTTIAQATATVGGQSDTSFIQPV